MTPPRKPAFCCIQVFAGFLLYSFPHLTPPGKADNPAMSLLESFRTPRWKGKAIREDPELPPTGPELLGDSFSDEAAMEDVSVGPVQ